MLPHIIFGVRGKLPPSPYPKGDGGKGVGVLLTPPSCRILGVGEGRQLSPALPLPRIQRQHPYPFIMGFFPLWGEATWRRGKGGVRGRQLSPALPLPRIQRQHPYPFIMGFFPLWGEATWRRGKGGVRQLSPYPKGEGWERQLGGGGVGGNFPQHPFIMGFFPQPKPLPQNMICGNLEGWEG